MPASAWTTSPKAREASCEQQATRRNCDPREWPTKVANSVPKTSVLVTVPASLPNRLQRGTLQNAQSILIPSSPTTRSKSPDHSSTQHVPGSGSDSDWRLPRLCSRDGRLSIGLPREQPNPSRGAAPGQHVSHPYGPKRPGGELN